MNNKARNLLNKNNSSQKPEPFRIISFIISFFWILALFFPVYWLLISSTKDSQEAAKTNPPSFTFVLPKDYTIYLDTTGVMSYEEDDFIFESLSINWFVSAQAININMNSITTAWVDNGIIKAKATLNSLTFYNNAYENLFSIVDQIAISDWKEYGDPEYDKLLNFMYQDGYQNNLNEAMPTSFASHKYCDTLKYFLLDQQDPQNSSPDLILKGKILDQISSKDNFKGLFNNYVKAWNQKSFDNTSSFTFARYFFNSLILALLSILLQFVFSASAAYGLTLLKKKSSRAFELFFLITIMIPGIVTQVPLYQFFMNNNMSNNYLAILIPGAVNAVNIVLFKAFFDNIPKDMREAAIIDGASEAKIYFKLIIPLASSVFIAIALMTFIGSWNNFFWPNLMIDGEHKELFTMPLIIQSALQSSSDGGVRNYSLSLAMSVVASIPTLFIFAFGQKQMKQGLMLGGIKG